MKICRTIAELREERARWRTEDSVVGLVPTMGALHAGHMALVARARAECPRVAVSLFVNPTQFAPGEDFAAYPRQLEEDAAKLRRAGVDLLFAPAAEEMYPPGGATFVDPGPVGERLDGASRPGHFRGVATVVAKLWNLFEPDRAYFGQKDAAQVVVLRAVARDLNVRSELVVCPTVREADGLAMSSRNRFLAPAERAAATVLVRALRATEQAVAGGERRASGACLAMRRVLDAEPRFRLDYAAVVDPDTLLPVETLTAGTLLAVAGWIGDTRLIDNLLLGDLQRGATP